jgi:RNA polymerase sigma-70 factor, ECF subfamily
MDAATEAWQAHRRYLFAVAYRMLGSAVDAEDVVQETYLRARRAWPAVVDDPRAWLVRVTSRLCLDLLASARVRRETYVGMWLPEPLVDYDDTDLGDIVALRESMRVPVLVVLERLSPAERVAFVLHDVFGMDYGRVADILERAPTACRQLASRARRAVREQSPPRTAVSPEEHEQVLAALAHASSTGDVAALVAVLAPGITLRADGGGVVPTARRTLTDPHQVARLLIGLQRLYPDVEYRPVRLPAGTGLALVDGGRLAVVVALEFDASRVASIDMVLNPAKLSPARAALAL